MLRENRNELQFGIDSQFSASPASASVDYNAHDVTVVVAALPAHGVVLRPDGVTALRGGEALTAAELAELRFAPALVDGAEASRWSGLAVCAPQNSGRLPIPVDPKTLASSASGRQIIIVELPTNGLVFLAGGTALVVAGQAITALQLCGLTFSPAENAAGKISVLRYADPDHAIVEDVLLIVGPDAQSQGVRAAAAGARDGSLAPIAVALLLDLGLSSSDLTVASAAVDPNNVSPAKSKGPMGLALGENAGLSAVGPVLENKPAAAAPPIEAQALTPDTGSTIVAATTPTPLTLVSGSSSPPAPVITSWSPDTGVVGDGLTDAAKLTLIGTAEANSSINVFDGATQIGTTTADSSGIWSFATPALTDATHVLTATATDSSGQTSTASAATSVTVDTLAPPPPVLTGETIVNVNQVVLTGTAEANSTINVYNGTDVVGVGVTNANGIWSLTTSPLSAGAHDLTATATDAAGNVSGMSAALDPVTGTPNAIVLENDKPGTPRSVWWVDSGQDSTKIQGFTTNISTNIGGTVQFKIDNETGVANYSISIYRLGYYGGNGARLVTTLEHQASSAVVQPKALTNAATGEVDAGNWSVTDSWTVPTDAVSGVYIANIVEGDQIFQVPFVIRNDSSTSDIVFQTSDETWQAYNAWGGANLYGGNGPGVNGSAYAVSYNRPITTRDGRASGFTGEYGTSNDMVFSAEFPTIYWLEENGYDVSYISGLDAATNGSLLLNHKVYMDSGHDEYWTDSQYTNVKAAGEAGVSLMFLSGNEVYWQTRFTASIDATADANRTLVSYKDTHANTVIDPSGTATSTFMDARFSSTGGLAGTPSNALTGQVFSVDSDRFDTITIPYGETQLRIWRDTSVATTAPGGTASLTPGILGYEWDSSPDNGFRPAGLVDVSSTTLQVSTLLLDYGNTTGSGTATHNLVEFRDPVSGALIFSTGTVFWSWGLSDFHDVNTGTLEPVDPSVQQATVNVLADMGVQPQTLEASLVIATASTDHTAPTSKITSLSATSVVEGQSVTVTGTATDVGGVIGGVEVSSDGGKTWHPATSAVGAATESWTYTFKVAGPGVYNLESRAVDDSINLETPSDAVSYTVTPSTNLTIFSPTSTPAVANTNDAGSVELGVQFVASVSGEITGIRFYKGAQNTGTHIGDLWTSSGVLLASATFTNETASGWQQVNFTTPVRIQAGQTYIASYHTNTGHYSTTDFYFDNAGTTNGSLTATGSGLNGVYAYGSGPIFPSAVSSANSDNYWVDVVFNDTSQGPQVYDDSGFTVAANSSVSIAASALLANDSDTLGLPFSLTSVSNPVNGTVSYNATTQTVTFTPSAGFAGVASFTYTVTDTSGAAGSGQVSVNVANPVTAQTLFGTTDTPSVANSGDNSSVEVGVKFTASASGLITGIRFYKGSANIGAHVADLWSSTGTLLATATFTNETASGWQQVTFSTPVAITAGVTYVASYHTSGNYSDSQNYFTTSLTSGQLTAPATGNGVYAYGTGSIFPTNTYKSTNYWVDVVYTPNSVTPQPPVANADSGFVVTANGSITIAASALLANDTDPNGLPLSITGVSNPVNGTASYNATTQTVTFTPTAGYTGTASFSYSITDANGGVASANVGLTVNTSTSSSLFSASATPSVVTVNDPSSVELGVKFTADANGLITGLRFYKGPQNTGTHVGDLWSSSGVLLASATFTNETASGWQQVNFSTPVAITAGVTYTASYHTNVGEYSANSGYFTSNVVSGDLTAPATGNGVYAYGTGSIFPTSTYNNTNYWVDVVYTKSTQGPVQPPVANADSGFVVDQNGSIAIAASALLANDTDPNGLPLSITGVSNPVNGTASYNATTQTVTFTPTAGYTGTASFSYSITDADGGVASANVGLSVNVNNSATASLFSAASTPSIVTVNDPKAVELGVKFQSSTNGEITGLLFYKGPQNTGTHVADLWGSSGVLLASATFTNETASGWQQVNFATPVAITAGTTYVASYHTNVGEYSADPNLLATTITNGSLTAPSSSTSGGNGVYAYGSASLFPTNSFNSTSYGVDVVFKAQLAA